MGCITITIRVKIRRVVAVKPKPIDSSEDGKRIRDLLRPIGCTTVPMLVFYWNRFGSLASLAPCKALLSF
ncbi:hypothetical protein HPP92_015480 [Vanilla planifolia]|uniref:Uncharacterized protein n=1 Tax=Vanilla planifolia TaxID=51239 RepID=A0A835QL97_VANPL|nr:hypothetical protein HPP92_015480 [Vanilla planifolia]